MLYLVIDYFGYATGKIGDNCLGPNYDADGIIAFTSKEKAQEELQRKLAENPGLEGEVIILTALVRQEFIPRERLKLVH